MKKAVIYIHGKGGNAKETEHYKNIFGNSDVYGFDYKAETPWEAKGELANYFDSMSVEYKHL